MSFGVENKQEATLTIVHVYFEHTHTHMGPSQIMSTIFSTKYILK